MHTFSCNVCHESTGNQIIEVREMMFGVGETFSYLVCAHCGCLQLKTVPNDFSRYYPEEYYPQKEQGRKISRFSKYLHRERAKYCLSGSSKIGRLLTALYGKPTCGIFGEPDYFYWLRYCNIGFSSRILDIGCGSGTLLTRLYKDGFKNLTGLDPYAIAEVTDDHRLRILKLHAEGLHEKFDLIMLHHTFEHLSDPLGSLKHFHRLLDENGTLLLRTPVASSFAYQKYGVNWAQIDAPRHLFIHTPTSIGLLAQEAGFSVTSISYDSTEFQFWASEQYARNIPLRDQQSYGINRKSSIFSAEDITRFKKCAAELNKSGSGDSACYFLRKSTAEVASIRQPTDSDKVKLLL